MGEPTRGTDAAGVSRVLVLMLRGVSPVWAEDSNIEYRCGRPHVASFATRRNGLTSPCCLLHVVAHFESLTSIRAFESFDWKVVFENFAPAWRRTACVRACVCACVRACVRSA